VLNSRVSGFHLRSATIVIRLTEHDDVTKITALRARAYVLRWAPHLLGPALVTGLCILSLEQWFSMFFVVRPIIASHYNPTTPAKTQMKQI